MAGETLWTTDHQTIQRWAEERGAVPAVVAESEGDLDSGSLCLAMPAVTERRLKPLTWDEFFTAFDERHLMFVYQETRPSGLKSLFYRFDKSYRDQSARELERGDGAASC